MPNISNLLELNFDNRFTRELPADSNTDNRPRQVHQACYSRVLPQKPPAPTRVAYSAVMAKQLGLSAELCRSTMFTEVFSGAVQLPKMDCYAM